MIVKGFHSHTAAVHEPKTPWLTLFYAPQIPTDQSVCGILTVRRRCAHERVTSWPLTCVTCVSVGVTRKGFQPASGDAVSYQTSFFRQWTRLKRWGLMVWVTDPRLLSQVRVITWCPLTNEKYNPSTCQVQAVTVSSIQCFIGHVSKIHYGKCALSSVPCRASEMCNRLLHVLVCTYGLQAEVSPTSMHRVHIPSSALRRSRGDESQTDVVLVTTVINSTYFTVSSPEGAKIPPQVN